MIRDARIISIWTAPEAKAPMVSTDRVEAVAGQGLRGDRYFYGTGAFSRFEGARREVTFISQENIESARMEYGIELSDSDYRRNIVTRGIDLEVLINKRFSVGEVTFEGLTTASPCGYLAKLTGIEKQALLKALPGIQCGLRARIVTGGTLSVGDPIE